jgi:hypothetical protein
MQGGKVARFLSAKFPTNAANAVKKGGRRRSLLANATQMQRKCKMSANT